MGAEQRQRHSRVCVRTRDLSCAEAVPCLAEVSPASPCVVQPEAAGIRD